MGMMRRLLGECDHGSCNILPIEYCSSSCNEEDLCDTCIGRDTPMLCKKKKKIGECEN